MADNEYTQTREPEEFARQFDRIKEVLDSIAYKIVQNTDDADFWDKVDFQKVLLKADAHYNTFIQNHGYARLDMYNGCKNIENKKKLELNPYQWLRGRNLGKSNKYYIEEVYE